MAGETQITVVGNITADPELRQANGTSVVNITIASTPRTFDRQSNEWKDGEALFLRASAWRELADHIAATMTKGMRVIALGNLKQRSYTDKEGNNRSSIEFEIIEIGPSLKYATAQVQRIQQGGQQGGFQQQGQPQGYGQQQGYGQPQGQPGFQPQTQGFPPQQQPQQQMPPQQMPPQQMPPQQMPPQQMPSPQNPGWGQGQQGFPGMDNTPF